MAAVGSQAMEVYQGPVHEMDSLWLGLLFAPLWRDLPHQLPPATLQQSQVSFQVLCAAGGQHVSSADGHPAPDRSRLHKLPAQCHIATSPVMLVNSRVATPCCLVPRSVGSWSAAVPTSLSPVLPRCVRGTLPKTTSACLDCITTRSNSLSRHP